MQKHKQILESKSELLLDSRFVCQIWKVLHVMSVFSSTSERLSKVFLCLKPLTLVIDCFQIDWQQVGQQIRGRRKTWRAGHDAETLRIFVFYTVITCITCTISNSSLRLAYTGCALHIFCVISRLRFDNHNCFFPANAEFSDIRKGKHVLALEHSLLTSSLDRSGDKLPCF